MTQNPATQQPCDPHDKVVCDGYLWSFLQGELDPAEALFVAVHCQLSCDARKRLKSLATCAGAALESIEPQTMRCSAQAFFAEKCEGEQQAPQEFQCLCEVPKPLQPLIGTSFDDVLWHTVHPGIQEARLQVEGSALRTRLMRLAQNAAVPRHSHPEGELTLVIRGRMADAGEFYAKGDVSIYRAQDGRQSHAPQALENCICLLVTRAPIRMPDWLARLLRPFQSLRS